MSGREAFDAVVIGADQLVAFEGSILGKPGTIERAAEQLRDRVTARVGRTMTTSIGSTFHSLAFARTLRSSDPNWKLADTDEA